LNGISISALYERALQADQLQDVSAESEPFDFGGDLVFMALGDEETSWFDEHAKFELIVPEFDNSALRKVADEQCDEGDAVA
jgi:hypothetical protein